MLTSLPTQVTNNTDGSIRSVTVVVNGEIHNALDAQAGQVVEILANLNQTEDERTTALLAVFKPATMLADFVDGERVTIAGGRVLFDGENVPTSLTNKIVAIARQGLDTRPWQRFVVRLFANPSRGAQAELNEFLEAADLPITDDGCFYAYKRVDENYMSIAADRNTGQHLDNSIGNIVEIPRQEVDPDRDRTCSYGLHFCSKDYLRHFYGGNGRIVIVKVSPTDVVSIPSDYQFTKGRTCRYEVVGEVDLSAEDAGIEWGIYDDRFTGEDADYSDPLGWDVYDDEDEVEYRLFSENVGLVDEGDELADLIDSADGWGLTYILDSTGSIVWESNTDDDDEFPEDGVVVPGTLAEADGTVPVETRSRLQILRDKFRSRS